MSTVFGSKQTQGTPIQIVLNVNITIRNRDAETFLQHFEPVFRKTSELPEVIYFIVHREDVQDEKGPEGEDLVRFHWSEAWTKDAEYIMTKHVTQEWFKPYFEAAEALFVQPRKVLVTKPAGDLFAFKP